MALNTTKSVVEIWNRALNRIGETKAIQNADERTAPAEVCRRHYGDCLVAVLEMEHWGFATKQSQLNAAVGEYDGESTYAVDEQVRYNGLVYTSVQAANSGNNPYEDDGTWWSYTYSLGVGWKCAYALPSDFVSLIAFLTSTGSRFDRQPFDIINDGNGTGTVMVTDVEADDFAVIEYTALPGVVSSDTGELIENPTLYPRHFVDAVVWMLAAELALAIKKDVGLADKMLAAGAQAVSMAKSMRRNNVNDIPEPTTPSVAVRQF